MDWEEERLTELGLRDLALQTCHLISEESKVQRSKGMFPKCPRELVMGLGSKSLLGGGGLLALLFFVLCCCHCNLVHACACFLFLSTNLDNTHTDENHWLLGPSKPEFES